jgi:hypothetical protein
MKKSIKVMPKKRRGRPATGKDPQVVFRMPATLISSVDKWAAERDISRSEAMRLLLEMALAGAKTRSPRYSEKTAAKARELAARAIDGLIDPAAPAGEKAVRKRRLLKGPSVFRDVRVDQKK